ncbi:MAG: UDP-GlcNAc:undecaprenyl-phosphate/decaprenyl-phosphate GlcNAc-phosphate transferase [Chloroflexota bacterium]|nr:UDP-GlcNAc:undecaprenyl-phosphate/decaprenyl-phosphate GlcNAc-phosphate transferase [Chloroflexota bacterium]
MIPDLSTASWYPALLPFLLASLVTCAGVPPRLWLARGVGAVDRPDAERRIHREPTPRLGGIAMFAGFAIAVAVFGSGVPERWQVVAVTAAITLAMAVDDVLRLPAWSKLVIEMGAGILVALLGITITFFGFRTDPGSILDLGLLAAPVTVVWLVGMQVSINLLDGVDGVAGGVVAIVAGVLLLAAINRLGGSAGEIQSGVIVMSGALMGCCFGFLFWNMAPARVFMGDSGSHFLGVAVGTITVLGTAKVAVALTILVPLVSLGLPIGDTAFAIVRRRRAGTGIAAPDAGHLHHRLLALGLSPRETALAFYLATTILGCIALGIFGHRRVLAIAAVLLVVALIMLLWRSHRRVPVGDPPPLLSRGAAVPTRARRGGEAD